MSILFEPHRYNMNQFSQDTIWVDDFSSPIKVTTTSNLYPSWLSSNQLSESDFISENIKLKEEIDRLEKQLQHLKDIFEN